MAHKVKRNVIFLVLLAVLVWGTVSRSSAQAPLRSPAEARFEKDVAPLFNKYCTGCHSGPRPQSDVTLKFKDEAEARGKATTDDEFWSKVETELSTRQMPPPQARNKPTDEERALLVDWIDNNL